MKNMIGTWTLLLALVCGVGALSAPTRAYGYADGPSKEQLKKQKLDSARWEYLYANKLTDEQKKKIKAAREEASKTIAKIKGEKGITKEKIRIDSDRAIDKSWHDSLGALNADQKEITEKKLQDLRDKLDGKPPAKKEEKKKEERKAEKKEEKKEGKDTKPKE